MDWIRALLKALSVTRPIWPPVKLMASWPWAWMAMAMRAMVLLLAGGEELIELALGRVFANLSGEVDEVVGCVAHGGDDDADLVSVLLGGDGALGGGVDPLGVCYTGSAEFLDDQGHRCQGLGIIGEVAGDSMSRRWRNQAGSIGRESAVQARRLHGGLDP